MTLSQRQLDKPTQRFPPTLTSTFKSVKCCLLHQHPPHHHHHTHWPRTLPLLLLLPLRPRPDTAPGLDPHPACTHHKQQLLHTLRHHVVKVTKVEVQGRPAHQLLLAQRASVLGLHCMLGECMSPHLVRLRAQEAAVWTAVYLRGTWQWRGCQGWGDPPSLSLWLLDIAQSPTRSQ